MNANKRKFNKVVKARKRHAHKVKTGQNNHAMGNTVAVLMKRGQLRRTTSVASDKSEKFSTKLRKKIGISKKKK